MNEDISNNILIEISNNEFGNQSITDFLTPLIRQPSVTNDQRLLESIFSYPGAVLNDTPRLQPPSNFGLRSPYLIPPPPPPSQLSLWGNRSNNIFPISEISNNRLQFSWINNPLPGRVNFSISGERIRPRRNFFETRRRSTRIRGRRHLQLLEAINSIVNNDIDGISNLTNRVLEESLYQDPDSYKKVLSKEGKNTIKTIKYSKELYTDICCPITYLEFKEGQEISLLPCGHIFTPESILDWLENEKAECPICRYKLSSKEIKKELDCDLDLSENVLPTRRNFFRNNWNNNNINTDVDLQRAILASIQNDQEENNDVSENNNTIIPWEIEENQQQEIDFSEDSWDEFSSDDDLLADVVDEEDIEIEHMFILPPPPPSTPPHLQSEIENSDISSSEDSINEFFDTIFEDIVDEEIV